MRQLMLKACLNGSRKPGEHKALPITADELATDARDSVAAGAGALHVHPRDSTGAETLEPNWIEAALSAIRVACPGVPVGVSSGAWIEADPGLRNALIRHWRVLPDFVSVNLSEPGAEDTINILFGRGIRVEAGIWSVSDARQLIDRHRGRQFVRTLIELIHEGSADEPTAVAQEIERALDQAGISAPRLLHGEGELAWPMLDYAVSRGYDIRIGLEDTLVTPDGRAASGNPGLVAEALCRADEARPDARNGV
jgi:uncharacterized protein (DUF849 family)